MAKNLSNVLVGGGGNSAVFVAPKGTTLPTGVAAPGGTFMDLGWLSEEGVVLSREEDRQVFRGHQGGGVVKRIVASADDSIKIQCLETTALVLGLLFKGQTPTVATGVGTITVTDQAKADERAWVFDEYLDDGSLERYTVPVGSAQLTAEVGRTKTGLTVYEYTVGIIGDYNYISNAPGVVA